LAPLVVGLASPFLVARPDFLLARDGRAMAWREGEVAKVWSTSGASLELADWRKIWPGARWQQIEDCDDGGCRLGQVQFVRRAADADCAAKLILAMAPLYDACPGVASVDRLDLWRNGAYAGWWRDGKARLVSDRDVRGARPWVPVAGVAAVSANPMAASE
jgi:competence protein ComEC